MADNKFKNAAAKLLALHSSKTVIKPTSNPSGKKDDVKSKPPIPPEKIIEINWGSVNQNAVPLSPQDERPLLPEEGTANLGPVALSPGDEKRVSPEGDNVNQNASPPSPQEDSVNQAAASLSPQESGKIEVPTFCQPASSDRAKAERPARRRRGSSLAKFLLIFITAALGCAGMVFLVPPIIVPPIIYGIYGNIAAGLLGGAVVGGIFAKLLIK